MQIEHGASTKEGKSNLEVLLLSCLHEEEYVGVPYVCPVCIEQLVVCPVCKGTTICLVVGCGAMNFLKFTWREHTGIVHFPMMLRPCMHCVRLLNRM